MNLPVSGMRSGGVGCSTLILAVTITVGYVLSIAYIVWHYGITDAM